MARRAGWTEEQWEEEGQRAILDLVRSKGVVPWAEVEARIAVRGWKDFRTVQPLQLTGARKALVAEGRIEVDTSEHHPPVVTLREPIVKGQKRRVERLRGEVRKGYRRYLALAGDNALCGKHAERVVLESLRAAAGTAYLFVPPQKVGKIASVRSASLPGTLDALAFILNLPDGSSSVPMLVEVKNVHDWIYPWDPRLWELLVKSVVVAEVEPVLPVLVCARTAYLTGAMARDIGFLGCQLSEQVFSNKIAQDEFDRLVEEFGLAIRRHEVAPHNQVMSFLQKTIRRDIHIEEGHRPWYLVQSQRFQQIAPVIKRFAGLAADVPWGARTKMFRAFRRAAESEASWSFDGGWG